MKSTFLISGLLICSLTCSCQKMEKTSDQTTSQSQTATAKMKADEIVRDTVTTKEGVQLVMAFNNTKQTVTFVLNGETIDLKQERMGSGIKYSNADYEYTEHQGEMTLKKGGNVVFSCRK